MTEQAHVRWRDKTLILQVYVQVRASRNEVSSWHTRGLKVRLKAPPVDGEANKQLTKFLAKQFTIPTSRIELLKGATSLQKTLAIENPATIPDWLTSIKNVTQSTL